MSDTPLNKLSLRRRLFVPLAIYVLAAGAYAGTAAERLKAPSTDNHYVYLANNLLHGRLSLDGSPPHQNDWALVTTLKLTDGRTVRGTFLKTGGTGWFKTTKGERLEITDAEIQTRDYTYYVSFPFLPALLMLPFVAIWGMKFNDILFTALWAGLNPVLIYYVLRRLRAMKMSTITPTQDLWLVAMFAFGTVHFFSSVMGQVWFTAHIIGVTITCLYVLAALEGRRPFLTGLMLGLGFITRTPIPFTFPLALGEVLRRNLRPLADGEEAPGDAHHRPPLIPWIRHLVPRVNWSPAIKQLVWMGIPAVSIAALAFFLNYLRYENPFEFGHYFLNVRWAERIQRWGLFNYHFLARNLAVMFTLLPWIMVRYPYVKIPWHGLSVFFVNPAFALLLRPQKRSPIQPWLYLSVLLPMVLHLFYQNSGWVQFAYRFSLDYMVFLFALLAVGGHRQGWLFKLMVIWSIVINTFGAVTFNRFMQFYWDGMFPVN